MSIKFAANPVTSRLLAIAVCASFTLAPTGCSRAPSLNIMGSFFPAWLFCAVVGIVLTIVVRILFVRANFEKELSRLGLVYPCLAAFFMFSIWLLLFR
jgi:hypothetical protein